MSEPEATISVTFRRHLAESIVLLMLAILFRTACSTEMVNSGDPVVALIIEWCRPGLDVLIVSLACGGAFCLYLCSEEAG